MEKVLTNFISETKMVLTDENSKIMSIINVPKSNSKDDQVDISDKLILAIKEDMSFKKVEITEGFKATEYSYIIVFTCLCTDEDDEEFEYEYTLIKTAEY